MIISGTPFTPGPAAERLPCLSWYVRRSGSDTSPNRMSKPKRCRNSLELERPVLDREMRRNIYDAFGPMTAWIAFTRNDCPRRFRRSHRSISWTKAGYHRQVDGIKPLG